MNSVVDKNLLVVSGISGRYPQSNSVDELWEKICRGLILYEKDPTPYPKGKVALIGFLYSVKFSPKKQSPAIFHASETIE